MNTINNQPREGFLDNGTLQVHSVWETIQGEGPFVGMPAVFVRLAGCNLMCPLCDTDYTSKRQTMMSREVVGVVAGIRRSGLVVLTGGEPFRQRELSQLCHDLDAAGFKVQIETNGVLPAPPSFPWDKAVVVCSPKTAHLGLDQAPDAFKYVIEAGQVDETDGLPLRALGMMGKPARPPSDYAGRMTRVYVQPLDTGDEDQNKRHRAAAVESALRFGYRLCLQTHKLLGLP